MYAFTRTALCVLAAIALCVGTANAAVTFTHQYNLGENDPGAVIGNVGNATTVDNLAGLHLNRYGSPTYAAGAPGIGSTTALHFTNTWGSSLAAQNYYQVVGSGNLIPTNYNWGVDFWVKISSFPESNGNDQYFVTIGGGGYSYQNNPDWGVKIGTKTVGTNHYFTLTDWCGWGAQILYNVPVNQWIHLAYVNKTPLLFGHDDAAMNAGDAHLYIDGVDGQSTYGAQLTRCVPYMWLDDRGSTTAMPTKITLGGMLYNGYDNPPTPYRGFSGDIDMLRVFTFAEGGFNIGDLHVVPEPGTLALLVAGLLGVLVYAWRKRK